MARCAPSSAPSVVERDDVVWAGRRELSWRRSISASEVAAEFFRRAFRAPILRLVGVR